MKKFYILLCLFILSNAKAQNVNFQASEQFQYALLTSNTVGGIAYNSAGEPMVVDTNQDGAIQITEAQEVWEIRIKFNSSLQGVQGLEYFTNLRKFTCFDTGVTTITFPPLEYLEYVELFRNFTSIDVQALTNLKVLDIQQTSIMSLDLSGLTTLENINISHNSIYTNIDVSQFPNLTTLDASYNGIHSINLTGSVQLQTLILLRNQIESIDMAGLTNLVYLNLKDNLLNDLNVDGFTNLTTLSCGTNNLTSLNIQSLTNLENLYCEENHLTTIDPQGLMHIKEISTSHNELTSINIQGLNTLENVNVSYNNLTTFDPHDLPFLKFLYSHNNQLTFLNASGLPKLEYLHCEMNQITELDIAGAESLAFLTCNDNLLTTINIEDSPVIAQADCRNNKLTSLLLKNGNSEYVRFEDNPDLTYICADENQFDAIHYQLFQLGITNIELNSYCNDTVNPSNTLIGAVRFYPDYNLNGPGTVIKNMKIYNEVNGKSTFSDENGNYSFSFYSSTSGGNIYAVFENPDLFYCPHDTFNFDYFSGQVVTHDIKFWLSNEINNPDIEVIILPITIAKPGEDIEYKILLRNKGNASASGTLSLAFNDDVLDVTTANPAINDIQPNLLKWDFTDIKPLDSNEISLILHANSPMDVPPVDDGFILDFTATATLTSGTDYFPDDNTFVYNQAVVNSLDPNDKTCIQGDFIPTANVGKYIDYIIRFENTGTATADTVIVSDVIDTKTLDINSFIALDASHPYTVSREASKIIFTFNNINLPFDDTNNNGYVAFKIKTQPSLTDGDIITNNAKIFFDYNFPITTNISSTTIGAPAAPNAPSAQFFCTTALVDDLDAGTHTGTINWYISETEQTAIFQGTQLINEAVYYVSQIISGYESKRAAVTVTISTPTAPEASTPQLFCNSATIANLTSADANIKWYDSEDGDSALTDDTPLVTNTTYYASKTINNCESGRTPVAVVINHTDAPLASPQQAFCIYALVNNLSAGTEDANIKWYANETDITPLDQETFLENGGIYYASQTINDCESDKTPVTVTITLADTPSVSGSQTFCNSATVADLVAGEANDVIKWYIPSGNIALDNDFPLTNGLYYVSKTVNGCESIKTPVWVYIYHIDTPEATPQQIFCNSATVGNLMAGNTDATIKWYNTQFDGNLLTNDIALINGSTYYASQTQNNCESERVAVNVVINNTNTPEASAVQTFCNFATIGNIITEGTLTNVKWYDEQSGGTILNTDTALQDGNTYYVSQIVNNCESERTPVMIIINQTAVPVGQATQTVNLGESLSSIEVDAEGTLTWYSTLLDAENSENSLPNDFIFETPTYTVYVTQKINDCESEPFKIIVSAVLGFDDFSSSKFTIYPNPVRDILNISSSKNIDSVEVYNMIGQKVYFDATNRNLTTIDMSQLAEGTYFIKINSGDLNKIVKVIKQ